MQVGRNYLPEEHFAARAAASRVELLSAAHDRVGDLIALVVLACHMFLSYLTPHDANPLYRISEKRPYFWIPEKFSMSREEWGNFGEGRGRDGEMRGWEGGG